MLESLEENHPSTKRIIYNIATLKEKMEN